MKIKTSDLVLTALLTAIAIIIPIFVPFKFILPPFSATLASHVPIFLAMFINPFSAIFVALGSALGFLFALGPIVAARAAMHVFFAGIGAYLIKKRANLYLVILVTMIIHAVSDMVIVYVLFMLTGAGILKGNSMSFVQYVIGIGTSIHHLVDFVISLVIYAAVFKTSKSVFAPISFDIKK